MTKPLFLVKKNLQKSSTTNIYFSDLLTKDVLDDVCFKITGSSDYDVKFVDNDYEDQYLEKSYNKGRLAILLFDNFVNYICFSEKNVGGRNASMQSIPTAFNIFYNSPFENKKLYFYFLNSNSGFETQYLQLSYRLMKTIGFTFLNESPVISRCLPFNNVDEIMNFRSDNSSRNRSNNSSYITKSSSFNYEIYGKTYGANKYDTSLICYAISKLAKPEHIITLFEIVEKDLKELPASCLNVINDMGVINVVPTDMQLEKRVFAKEDSLRSPRYLFNLLEKLGHKHCAFCGCEIPEIIQGAHIWPVSAIKKQKHMNMNKKLLAATDGDNGIWLCENHHKLFDCNIIQIRENGDIVFVSEVDEHIDYLDEITTNKKLSSDIMNEKFVSYLRLRNESIAL